MPTNKVIYNLKKAGINPVWNARIEEYCCTLHS